ncbi:hypothetical protein [Chryseobacterium sp. A301]
MKKTLIILIGILPLLIFGQRYVLLSELQSNFKVNSFNLDTKDIYDIDEQIRVHNVYVSPNTILLFSELPDLEPTKSKNVLELKDIKGEILSGKDILKLVTDFYAQESVETPFPKTFEIILVREESGKYIPSKTLTELFHVKRLPAPMVASPGVINILEDPISIANMKKVVTEDDSGAVFLLDVRANAQLKSLPQAFSNKYYLSKKYEIAGKEAYQFWTLDGWYVTDGYDLHRGIDRFVYIENLGIVGGSFDFYFKQKPTRSSPSYFTVSKEILWDNIINEKVMVAKEL